PNSAVSDWVEKEYTQALGLRKKIIPIMLARSRVPFALNTINYIDFRGDDYADNLNRLLATLGYTGEPVTPTATLPAMLRKYVIPIIIGVLIVLALISRFIFTPPTTPIATQTPTPSTFPSETPIAVFTLTDSPTVSPTASSTVTLTLTVTETPTLKSTLTSSPTQIPFNRLTFCVNSVYANSINVRSGPGTIYPPIGQPLQVGKCLDFSARNEEATWLQIAPNQPDATLEQYVGGWIFRELLGLGTIGPIDLPAVTLTPTPIPSDTSTITPTFTRTPTETPSPTETEAPTSTETPTP
ncbi:MAG TPA: toll/interleukin-1 receptor domain-containing protein, partial [Anaerolineales bacterium]